MNILNSYKPESKHPPENLLKKYSQDDALVFLLRHGQICGSDKKRFIGITDVGLDPIGVLQATYWKQAFTPLNMDVIYSSLLDRCNHTARLIAKGKKVIKTSALNEINMGSWDGKTFDQIKTHHPKEFKKRGESIDTFKVPDAESFYDVSCRVIPFFDHCINNMGKKILIVAHAGVIRVILCHILNLKLKELLQIKVSYGELFVIQKY
ncbi:MAG: histidine phosphatase family protein [Desulfobacterales bacterium]|nr:histidine phosphatase family protein [Desulfobacterales bacterium]